MNIYQRLRIIQTEIKAPKERMNKFGGYKYRNCEDILKAIKPLLKDCVLIISDELVLIGERYYMKATASLIATDKIPDQGSRIDVTSLAREDLSKKGMDASQVTGTASSYARKYALNGLLGIDDTKDSDATNTHGGDSGDIKKMISRATTQDELMLVWRDEFTPNRDKYDKTEQAEITKAFTAKKETLNG